MVLEAELLRGVYAKIFQSVTSIPNKCVEPPTAIHVISGTGLCLSRGTRFFIYCISCDIWHPLCLLRNLVAPLEGNRILHLSTG
ncbi:hypothetical protein BT96DRAFT_276385 [Gymnopus androsaceus JB14]|uniref:Uncharacterized protein n=1 Tax=Gymnopus androsaceus JB14 TaxID=1447944 RepID=A0A6A4GAD1_9AGAR|nr:hypothetical protein BT96DRAFT_276385 [Gymnopus androsaceus JB14]